MFCPKCQDEFRPGFERCASCNVDLVPDLDAVEQPVEKPHEIEKILRYVDYCGFLSLVEARDAREKLRGEKIRSDILIRDAPGSTWEGPAGEEFWLRVDSARLREIPEILGPPPQVEASTEGTFACGECGQLVAGDADRCPSCRAEFD
jgi:hypothetical protein